MLIQVSTARLGYVQGQVDLGRSGLILCGTDAVKKAGTLRYREGYAGPLLIDPAVYPRSSSTILWNCPWPSSGTREQPSP
jgi:hypothetical protein